MPLISTRQADEILEQSIMPMDSEEVDVSESRGKILAQEIISERDLPPFHRVAMDGIAIKYDSSELRNNWKIIGIQKAGEEGRALGKTDEAIEIMTGAVLPAGSNCVIPYEQIRISGELASLSPSYKLSEMLNIHPRGKDSKQGECLLSKGERIGTPEIGIIVSQGLDKINIRKDFLISIISTGDELVPPGRPIEDYQIRMSNPYVIQNELQSWGFNQTSRFHLRDQKEEIHAVIEHQLENNDVIILSGGVSKGKFDFVPSVLSDLKVDCLFHGVAQRPGKPIWFGQRKDNKYVFGLPGNPVSSLFCLRRYVIPFLEKCQGVKKAPQGIELANNFSFTKPLTYFAPVKWKDGMAEIITGNGSGDFISLRQSSGLVELNADQNEFEKGQLVDFYQWGSEL